MQQKSPETSQPAIWTGKPWVVADVITRSIVVFVVAAIVIWLEFYFNEASVAFLGFSMWLWTALVFLVIWIASLIHLLLLRATNTYVLRNDSLEIKTGIVTSKSFIIAASGFADMEVVRSISARLLNLGDIIIRTQDETGRDRKMIRVKDPTKVANQIREVMAKPIVRIEGQPPPSSQNK